MDADLMYITFDGMRIKDFTNQVFGNRRVLEISHIHRYKCGAVKSYWKCECQCGHIDVDYIVRIKKYESCETCLRKEKGYVGCVVQNCDGQFFAKKMCKYHYEQWYKGWLTDDGKRTKEYKGSINKELDSCKIASCERTPTKKGFCNKHYKWLRKGRCHLSGKILYSTKRSSYDDDDTCAVDDCDDKPRRAGFCNKHSKGYYKGEYDKSGGSISYPRDWPCVACHVKGVKIIEGFCEKHYPLYKKGIIDFNGRVRKHYI